MPDPSLLVRRPLRRDDIDALLALIRACEQHSPIPIVTTRSDVEKEFDEPHQDLRSDTLTLVDNETSIIAYIWTSMRPHPTREQVVHISGRVHPEWMRHGIAGSLIEWAVERAKARLADHHDDLPAVIRAYVYEEDIPAVRAYESKGFRPERYFVELARDLSDPFIETKPPPGISLTEWSQEIDDVVRVVHNMAFRDHWGSEPLSESRWRRWLSGSEHFLPNASFVAMSGTEVIGYSMSAAYPQEWAELGHSEGWIDALGTILEWRKRGIASLLIEASVQAFRALGYDRASLGVDTANPSGALGLYTRHGFDPTRREVSYSIRMS